jgi:hypothetical protein
MKKYLPFILLALLVIPLVVYAQATAIEVVICNILQIAKNIAAAIGIAIVIIMIVVSGIKYMTAGGDAEKANNAKKGIINGLIGVVIIVGALFLIALAQSFVASAQPIAAWWTYVPGLGDPCRGYIVP